MQAAAAPVDAAAAASHGWEVRPVAEAAAEAGPSSGVPQAAPVVPRGTALVWLRRDLRLDDNPALTAALKTGGTVVRPHTQRRVAEGGRKCVCQQSLEVRSTLYAAHCPDELPAPQVVCFIWAPDEEGQLEPGRCNRWWLHSSLKALSASLRRLGSRLVLRAGRQVRPRGCSLQLRAGSNG
jgi:deoxyribodipyrimidine photolyase